ncbi:hypothetical protein KFL_000240390 [Klebsormidium nitens]|uniref:Serine hydrolase domain-containing protein n=1 Tax=Klebsormidium nitens TaxID=105231 RepID=A0A1Y1HRB7_KLENI|nr:hypothetical protein KFL_000240390 [Klebsormidium nitens]|eukprot:GAQ79107.1 hypothetical protein KFL_000240390 [Klebsormidium nitens]
MGSIKKLRLLCLHSFRTSAHIFQKQMERAMWTQHFEEQLDMVFLDAPHQAAGPSDVAAVYDPPYFEWANLSDDRKEFRGIDDTIAYVTDYLTMHGPFDGLMGFSQGAIVSSILVALQQKGAVLQGVPPLRCCVFVGGGRSRAEAFRDLYETPIRCPSLHLIGDNDFMKLSSQKLASAFQNPTVVRHPQGHVVPKLDDAALKACQIFFARIQEAAQEHRVSAL